MLSSKQRSFLRHAAHALKPVHQIGKEGLTVPAVRAVEAALNTREIIKVKVLEACEESAQEVAGALAERIEAAEVVQVMGRIVTLYRPHPEQAVLTLPK